MFVNFENEYESQIFSAIGCLQCILWEKKRRVIFFPLLFLTALVNPLPGGNSLALGRKNKDHRLREKHFLWT